MAWLLPVGGGLWQHFIMEFIRSTLGTYILSIFILSHAVAFWIVFTVDFSLSLALGLLRTTYWASRVILCIAMLMMPLKTWQWRTMAAIAFLSGPFVGFELRSSNSPFNLIILLTIFALWTLGTIISVALVMPPTTSFNDIIPFNAKPLASLSSPPPPPNQNPTMRSTPQFAR